MLTILFPSEPFKPTRVEPAFLREWEVCHDLGINRALVDTDVLMEGRFPLHRLNGIESLKFQNITRELEPGSRVVVYRGWILSAGQYGQLYRALWDRGYRMINTPQEYRFCQELPSWYPHLEGGTPKSIWFEPMGKLGFDLNLIAATVEEQLGMGPYIIKDFVKSQKHAWKEACFIPSPEAIVEVTRRFIELQGSTLAGGLVYRQYVPFRRVGTHPKSGMPLCNEVRTMNFRSYILPFPYWGPEEGGEGIAEPSHPLIAAFNRDLNIRSSFYSMDLAEREDGVWEVVELGDGQVTGLPPHADIRGFYEALGHRFSVQG